jgi:4-diphosphocytidyl-2-C-methyl-D-erythritol kinase
LRIGKVRDDGFHPLASWMVTVGLFDKLRFTHRAEGVALRCDDPSLPTDERNLVVRAAVRLASECGLSGEGSLPHAGRHPPTAERDSLPLPARIVPGVQIELEKRIPQGGGLGGGSGNAATTLLALRTLWGVRLSDAELHEIAAQLGSDVPFFLSPGGSAWCEGRGERITPAPVPAAQYAVLMLPGIAMPTPAVYKRFDERVALGLQEPGTLEGVDLTDWSRMSATQLLSQLVNDLEPAAFDLSEPLATLRTSAEQIAGQPVRMSGSGSTLFTLTDDSDSAQQLSAKLSGRLGVKAQAVEIAPDIGVQ